MPGVLGAAALFVTAVVTTWVGLRATAGQGYWQDGYHRLLAASIVKRFDPAALAVIGALVVLTGFAVLLRRRGRGLDWTPGARARTAAGITLLLIGGLRLAFAVDGWRRADGPNLLLISIDTLRADHLGAYGYDRPTSPVVDRRLAGEGVTFEEVYSQSPKTTPSHMTMLTSLYPSVHGIDLWQEGAPGRVLSPRVDTLAEVLKNAGYATAAFTGGANLDRSRGFDQGFDVYKHDDQLGRARRWLGAHRGGKFFLFFHTYAVHDPYVPPPDLVTLFAPDFDGPVKDAVTRLRRGEGGWWARHRLFWESVDPTSSRDVDFVTRLYDAGIREMDRNLMAPLLDTLDRLGLANRTLVVFTGDHGEAFAEHGVFLHDDLYRGTLHVPLVFRLPGRLAAGRRVAAPAALVDLMPTVLGLIGVAAPPAVQGRNLASLVLGSADSAPGDIVSEYSQPENHRVYETVRRGSLTYMVDTGVEALYDRGADPVEQRNILAAEPALADALRSGLARWREASAPLLARLGPRAGSVVPNTETVRRLRALGYLE